MTALDDLAQGLLDKDECKDVAEIEEIAEDVRRHILKVLQSEQYMTAKEIDAWMQRNGVLESERLKEAPILENLIIIAMQCMSENGNIKELLRTAKEQPQTEAAQQASAEIRSVFLHSVAKVLQPPAPDPRPVKSVMFPLDKLNSSNGIWNEMIKSGEQRAFSVERKGSEQEIDIFYMLDLSNLGDDVKITRSLNRYDKRLHIAAASLYDAGNDYMSVSQLYHAMGNKGSPSGIETKRIEASLTKMNAAQITIDNTQEVTAGYKYQTYKYTGSLLPHERATITRKGKTLQVVHLFRRPPLIDFAESRKQITRLNPELLCTPWKKTDDTLAIEDYLLTFISRQKQDKRTLRILLETMYRHTDITTAKQKKRITDRLPELLDYYTKCGLIASYSIDKEALTVRLPATQMISQGKRGSASKRRN